MAYKEMIFLKGLAKGQGYFNTSKAITIATDLHKEQFRKSREAYIDHPMRVTSGLIALQIYDDIAWLHPCFTMYLKIAGQLPFIKL